MKRDLMRLICPNCDAQYEVPDDVIPPAGRDVQCSNCSNTWFFRPVRPEDLETPHDPEVSVTPAPPAPPPTAPAAPRRQLDPQVADVLRQEAEFEARARAADQAQLETQPDLGLDAVPPIAQTQSEANRRAEEARQRMARIRGRDPSAPAQPKPVAPQTDTPPPAPTQQSEPLTKNEAARAATAAASVAEASRRDLLPDVEEINSTLRASEDRDQPQDAEAPHRDEPKAKSGGFRGGFIGILALAGLGIGAYVFETEITEQVPQAAAPLQQYVNTVDQGRTWLDGQVLAALAQLDAIAAQSGGSSETDDATPQDQDG